MPSTTDLGSVDDMLRERDNIHCSFTTEPSMVNPVGAGGSSSSRYTTERSIPESPENGSVDGRDKFGKRSGLIQTLIDQTRKPEEIFYQRRHVLSLCCTFQKTYRIHAL
uniref:Uncharacterized protein n=1 Tax=Arundo donax TaxID=35708 RepID=A0A0A9GU56_ARUDO